MGKTAFGTDRLIFYPPLDFSRERVVFGQMTDTVEQPEISEKLRAHAAELAARVRFLREEIMEGKTEGVKELKTKADELAALFPVNTSVARINFDSLP